MTDTQIKILELFQTLPVNERRELALMIHNNETASSFFDTMTAEQRAELAQSIAEADRGEGAPVAAVFNHLAAKHGFSRTA